MFDAGGARSGGEAFASFFTSGPLVSFEPIEGHIARLWDSLPEQSQRRLGVLAVSTLEGVGVEEHADLCGALGLIAEAEGTLDVEREFAETYLGTEWVCRAVAELEHGRQRASTREQTPERREQTRAAVARHRASKKVEASKKEQKKRQRKLERLGAVAARRAIAIDGEGMSLPDGSHVYRYLAAVRSDGKVLGELYDRDGIVTLDALDFIAGLPKVDEDGEPYLGIFGYGLGYDQAKWLEGLRNRKLYRLYHDGLDASEREQSALAPADEPLVAEPIVAGPYRLKLIGKCFEMTNKRMPKGLKQTRVWDILKGFQSTFVKAIKDWKVGTAEEWERIEAMKKKRGQFARESLESVKRYCKDECRLLAQLVETYVRAHIDAGIDLQGKYHGAGSTSDAFLMLMSALDKRCTREVEAEDLEAYTKARSAYSRAFFGGRAEVSMLGIVTGPVWTADIASAYPHALFELPCVRHGKWRHVKGPGVGRAVEGASVMCVHYEMPLDEAHYRPHDRPRDLRPTPGKRKDVESLPELKKTVGDRSSRTGIEGSDVSTLPWGPLPYRTALGSIVFPASHPGGWAWAPEYAAAKRHFSTLRALEGWSLRSECRCDYPYRAIGEFYLQRLEWGRGGANRGKPLKLGMNGCYGKFAQVVGKNPKYACRVVAGHITATTRARLTDAIMTQPDPWSILYAATDGLIATAPMAPPDPPENETGEGARREDKLPLGFWEVIRHDESLFLVQPGFYFSLEPKGKARTRGTPLEVIDEYRQLIIDQWKTSPTKKPTGLPQQDTFHGVKTAILRPTKATGAYRRKKTYGRWTKEERKINYVVSPKRSDLEAHGPHAYRLLTWTIPPSFAESAEYAKDPTFAELDAAKEDQPDFVEPLVRGVGEDD